jgi:hypothetical protein
MNHMEYVKLLDFVVTVGAVTLSILASVRGMRGWALWFAIIACASCALLVVA